MSSAEMHPWTHAHWTHCHLSHCCWHRCHQLGWGLGKAGVVGAQGTGLLQDKRILLTRGPLPHQPLLRGHSCLGHVENRTEKVEMLPQMHQGALRPG